MRAFFVALARLLWLAYGLMLAFLHRMVPSRVLRIRAGAGLRLRATPSAMGLLLDMHAVDAALGEALDAGSVAAVTLWDNAHARVMRYLVPSTFARPLLTRDGRASSIARSLDETFGPSAPRPKGHIIGATHNGRDVTAALRPWSLALAVPNTGATGATVAALVGRAHGPDDKIELLWDRDFAFQTLREDDAVLAA